MDLLQNLGFGRLGRPRQQNHDSRPLVRFTFDVDQSAVIGDNAANRGEPQAGALAALLVVKKGSKRRCRVFASMPRPLSETTSRTQGKAELPCRASEDPVTV